MKKIVSTKEAPAAIGPYSQGTIACGMIFVSGQIPVDPATGEFVSDDIKEQTEQSLKNLQAVLKQAGATLDDVVKTGVFIQNMDDFAVVNEVYAKYFSKNCPARSCVEVGKLPKGALVEIEAIACRGKDECCVENRK